ncbi:hypothetical protein B0E46_12620 [Rhodanobacter sp. B04]|uniref:tetratricopeptide repeat protein n=1 Tax=Rhodanobacter sp. B04 TaxID=1945860 RepID=UPI000985BC4D|nr:tetratricopeptide repeat protein [Rhodanobacter sp. B04]OOG62481.1 hypothetical protein B0E46_12620 [Rhodanobacter sp. B04]
MLASAALLLGLASSPALAKDAAKSKQEVLYPNATRVAPKLDMTSAKEQKALNEGLDAVAAGDKAKAEQVLQPLVDGSKSKYVQALALQGLATIKYNDGDTKGAITLLKSSLDNGVMPNETYFQLEYELAQFYLADEQYQLVLDTVENWRAQGKREWANSYALEANADYRLQKYPEAIAAVKKAESLTDKPDPQWNQILMASYTESGQTDELVKMAQQELAAHPDDPATLTTAIQALQQAQKYPEAIQLMEAARAKGALTGEANYVLLASLYFNQALTSDDPKPDATKAAAVVTEGLSKGIVQPTADTYLLLGKAEYEAGDTNQAMQAYNKALPLAKDGEIALQIANMQLTDSKYAEAKSMIQQAISKGVKHQGIAYLVLAESERGLNHKSAQIAALNQAAKDPETAERAKASLKKLGATK